MQKHGFGGLVLVALLGGGCSGAAIVWSVIGFLTNGSEYYAVPLFWGLIGCALFLPMLAIWHPWTSSPPEDRANVPRASESGGSAPPAHPYPARRSRKDTKPAASHVAEAKSQEVEPSRHLPRESPGHIEAPDASRAGPIPELEEESTAGTAEPDVPAAEPAEALGTAERMEVRLMTVAGFVFLGFAVLFAFELTQEGLTEAAMLLVLGLLCFRRLDKLLRR